jgi:hypothetical protein
MIWWSLVAAELGRRRRRTALTIVVYGCLVTLFVGITSLVAAIQGAQTSALAPAGRVERNLYISMAPPSGRITSADLARSLALEHEATQAAAVLDLAHAGTPGQHFVRDIFLPITAITFPGDMTARVKRVRGVADASAALSTVATHQEGTVPNILAEYTVEPATIALQAPSASEQAAMQLCEQRFIASLPPTTGPSIKGQSGAAVDIPFTNSYFACLPPRLRSVQIEEQVIHQIINPPQTDIKTAYFSVTGIDAAKSRLGVLTKEDVVDGRFLDAGASNEALLQEGYAHELNKALGSTIELHGVSYRIVGLVRPALAGMGADIYLPLTELEQMSDRPSRANVIVVRAAADTDLDTLATNLRSRLPGTRVWSATQAAGQLVGTLKEAGDLTEGGRSVALWLISLLGLGLVGAISWSGLTRRHHELATLRSMGWTGRALFTELLTEEIVLGAVGIGVGLAVAAFLLLVFSHWGPVLHAVVIPTDIGEQISRPVRSTAWRVSASLDWGGAGLSAAVVLAGVALCVASAVTRLAGATPTSILRGVH